MTGRREGPDRSRRPAGAATRDRRGSLGEPAAQPAIRPRAGPWQLLSVQRAAGNRVVQRLLALRIQRMSDEEREQYFTQAMGLLMRHEPKVAANAPSIVNYYETGGLTQAIEGKRVLDEIKAIAPHAAFFSNLSKTNKLKASSKGGVKPDLAKAAARLFSSGFGHDNNAGRYVVIKAGNVDAAKADAAKYFGHGLSNPRAFTAKHSSTKEARAGTLWVDGGVVVRSISSYNFYPTIELKLGALTVEFKYRNA